MNVDHNRVQQQLAALKKPSAITAETGDAPAPTIHYVCDPGKNTECAKTKCYIYGGPCMFTTKVKFAKQPIENIKLIVPAKEEDFE